MPLLLCPDCNKRFSSRLSGCPECGCPAEHAKAGIDAPGLVRTEMNDGHHAKSEPRIADTENARPPTTCAGQQSMYYFIPYQMAIHHEVELAAMGFSVKRHIPVSVENVSRVAATLKELRVLCPGGATVLFGRSFMEYRIGDLRNGDILVLAHGSQFAIVRYEANNAQPSEAPTPPMDEMAKTMPIKKYSGMAEGDVPPIGMDDEIACCRGCGKEIHESAVVCPECGAVQNVAHAQSLGKSQWFYWEFWRKGLDFSSRTRRRDFFLTYFINCGVVFLLGIFSGVIGNEILIVLFILASIIPDYAIWVRRLHDIGKSGRWIFIILVPLVGGIIMLIFLYSDSQKGANIYGADPKGRKGISRRTH